MVGSRHPITCVPLDLFNREKIAQNITVCSSLPYPTLAVLSYKLRVFTQSGKVLCGAPHNGFALFAVVAFTTAAKTGAIQIGFYNIQYLAG